MCARARDNKRVCVCTKGEFITTEIIYEQKKKTDTWLNEHTRSSSTDGSSGSVGKNDLTGLAFVLPWVISIPVVAALGRHRDRGLPRLHWHATGGVAACLRYSVFRG